VAHDSSVPAGPAAPAEVLSEVVDRLGGVVTTIKAAHSVEFDLAGLPGLAHVKDGRVRVSVFLVFDPDELDAADFVAAHGGADAGEVDLVDVDGGRAVRVLGQRPVDVALVDGEWAPRLARAAHALRTAWRSLTEDRRSFAEVLNAEGVVVPPRGDALRIEEASSPSSPPVLLEPFAYGEQSWGSTLVEPALLTDFDVPAVAQRLIREHAMFLLRKDDGIRTVELVSTHGPIAVFLQHPLGVLAADAVRERVAVNTAYVRVHELFRSAGPSPAGRVRWLAAHSTVRGRTGLLDLEVLRGGGDFADAWRPVHAADGWDHERALFEELASVVRDEVGSLRALRW
jgi:hypothetical protein